ncbi:MAG: outer membrane protein assembly factor BamE [Chthoniobacterales bacterium]
MEKTRTLGASAPTPRRSVRASLLWRAGAVGVAILGLAVACLPGERLTKANVAEVSEGMTKKQVESILGAPSSIDTKDLLVSKKTTYLYAQGKESVTIVFRDDKVQSKESTLSK